MGASVSAAFMGWKGGTSRAVSKGSPSVRSEEAMKDDLTMLVHKENRFSFDFVLIAHPHEWVDYGVVATYNLRSECRVFRQAVRDFVASAGGSALGDSLRKRMYSLIGYARCYCAVHQIPSVVYENVKWESVSEGFHEQLSRNCESLRRKSGAPLYMAQKYSMMCAFIPYWRTMLDLLRSICDGPLTYPFSMSEACVAVHMVPGCYIHPGDFIYTKKFADDEEFYVKFMIGACSSFLKWQGLFPEDFCFHIEAGTPNDTVLLDCSAKFLNMFIDRGMMPCDQLD